jgi:hypothetical protein
VKEEERKKGDAGEVDNNCAANEVESTADDKETVPINLERISLTQGKSIGNWGLNDGRERYFIYWYKAVEKEDSEERTTPSFLWRLVAFLIIAKWDEMYVPSMAFRKVLVGVPQEKNIERFHKNVLGWIGSSMFCLFGIISLTPIVFVLGPFTGGHFWSEEMKVNIFFGEIEAPVEKVEDQNEGASKDSSS